MEQSDRQNGRRAPAGEPGQVIGRQALRSVLAIATLVLALPTPAALGGAWTLEQGTGQAIVGGLASTADAAFKADGGPAGRPQFSKGAVEALVEYGVTDWFTLIGEGEIGSESEDNAPFARPALGHIGLGGRVRLLQRGGFVASAQIAARIADAHDGTHDAADSFGWTSPELDAKALAGYGFSLGDYPSFVEIGAGYRRRTEEGTPDEAKLDLTVGIRPRPDFLVLAQSFSTVSREEPETLAGYDYHKAQLSGVFDLNETWSVQAGGFATVAGTNALKERGLLTALWLRF